MSWIWLCSDKVYFLYLFICYFWIDPTFPSKYLTEFQLFCCPQSFLLPSLFLIFLGMILKCCMKKRLITNTQASKIKWMQQPPHCSLILISVYTMFIIGIKSSCVLKYQKIYFHTLITSQCLHNNVWYMWKLITANFHSVLGDHLLNIYKLLLVKV